MPIFQTREEVADRLLILWTLLVCAVVAGLVLSATSGGIGMTPDSVQYLAAATSWLEGKGLAEFPSHWPPGYPLAIAAVASISGDPMTAAAWLNAASAATSLMLFATIARHCRWRRKAVAALLAIGLHPGFLHVHFLLWSEALFLVFALANLLLLRLLVSRRSGNYIAIAIVAIVGCAVMVRYAGLFLVGFNAVALLTFARQMSIRQRAVSAAMITIASVAPLMGWIAFNRARGVEGVNRALSWHPPDSEHALGLNATLGNWFGLPDALGLAAATIVVAMALWTLLRARTADKPVTPALVALAILGYSGFLLLSISVVDHHTPLDERVLFPMFALIWLLLFEASLSWPSRLTRGAATALLALMLVRGGWHGAMDWGFTREHGLGLTRKQVREMPVLDWMRTLPAQLPVVTNGPELCLIYLDRSCPMLPPSYNPTSLQPNPDAKSELERLTRGPSIIVNFEVMSYRTYLPDTDTLEGLSDVTTVYRGPDAVAWVRSVETQLP